MVYHVTDLGTLDCMANIQSTDGSQCLPYAVLPTEPRFIKNLDITLRLPLTFFQALADYTKKSSSSQSTQKHDTSIAASLTVNVSESDLRSVWMRVWPALAIRSRELQRLHIWIDHDVSKSWSLVEERLVLSYITTWISPDSVGSLKSVIFNIPKLHPRHEDPQHHFTTNSPQPPGFVKLIRRLRQCYFYEETAPEVGKVDYEPDFPVLFELCDYTADPGPPMLLEEVEEMERDMWKRGQDPNDFLWDLAGPGARCGF